MGSVLQGWPKYTIQGDGIASALAASALAGAGQVIATSYGVIGDPGIDDVMAGVIGIANQSAWLQATQTASTYAQARAQVAVSRLAKDATIVSKGPLMAMSVGLDNRMLLPPFIPMHRNEDGVFSATLCQVYPQHYLAHLPYAVCHVPLTRRTLLPDFGCGMRFSELILAMMADCRLPNSALFEDSGRRMSSLGEQLWGFCSLPRHRMRDYLDTLYWRLQSGRVTHLEKCLQAKPDAPTFWVSDVKGMISLLRSSLGRRVTFTDAAQADEAVAMVRSYADLLRCWPSIIAAAREMRSSGTLLGEIIT